jgi:D-glycero-alpha-D-manno-heptose-7-phosphate kinase
VMITSRTPLRISFLGGGTDFPTFFNSNIGYVLGTTINKYVYVNILPLPQFAEERYRFTYRVTESVMDYREILHPVVRAVLSDRDWALPLNIATMADLPGRSGLGSSSSFTVGFLRGLNHFEAREVPPSQLARDAVKIERELLCEPGGWQDQYQGAIGGFRLYKFDAGTVTSNMIPFENNVVDYISDSLVLVPMQNWRDSGGFAEVTSRNVEVGSGHRLALNLASLTLETSQKLVSNSSLQEKFEYLCSAINLAWSIKVELSQGTLDPKVQEKIAEGLARGASAGRLCGAGGTGFLLFLVPPALRKSFVESMAKDLAFSISVEKGGSKIL